MHRSDLAGFALACLIGISAGLPAGALADDTEIYLGPKTVNPNVRPNVLFILDTSGSMGRYDSKETGTRMQRMQKALDTILKNTNDINVGLMRFTSPGGPVLFPVSYIDANANAISPVGQADVNVRIRDGADDAEEFAEPSAAEFGDVILDSVQLELVDTPAFAPEQFLMRQISDARDDAEQCQSSPSTYGRADTVLESVNNSVCDQHVGLRFRDLPADTDGATVLRAQIDMSAASTRDDDVDLSFSGQLSGGSGEFAKDPKYPACGSDPAASTDVLCRLAYSTAASIDWTRLPDTVSGDVLSTPDLAPIVQEIFDHPDWQSGGGDDDLTLLYSGSGAGRRDFYSRDQSSAVAPAIRIDYVPAGAPSGRQLIGLRFQDVRIPQGMKILNAVIEFTAARDSDAATSMTIYGEASDDAAPFAAVNGNLSGRALTSGIPWTLDATTPWVTGEAVQTPNLQGIVQGIVSDSGWCGGNDMAFLIEADSPVGRRLVRAYDDDPSAAPTLRISYDENTYLSSGQGCTVQDVQRQVKASDDDARERLSNGRMKRNDQSLPLAEDNKGRDTAVGLRFQDVPLSPGAQVLAAELDFTAIRGVSAGASKLTVHGHLTGDAPTFSESKKNISGRPLTSASASFAAPASAVSGPDQHFVTADLSTVINEIVNPSTGWQQGNALALIVTGSDQIRVRAYDKNPAQAPLLRLKIRQNLGDLTDDLPVVPVRDRLRDIVQGLPTIWGTPIVDTLYEAALYFRGENVLYGRQRNTSSWYSLVRQRTRVSHPATYSGGTLVREAACTDANLNAAACESERIDGNPSYISPITNSCQQNFIVLLTDGEANSNHSSGVIESMTGQSCDTTLPGSSTAITHGQRCGLDIVRYLANNDQNPGVSGKDKVITHTIGFNFSSEWLKKLAETGKGKYYEAASPEQLVEKLEEALGDIRDRTTSFAAPSLSVNSQNKLYHNAETYFSLFKPSPHAAWDGNVKKYKLRGTCTGVTGDCTLGELLDANDKPAIDTDGFVKDTALSLWSAAPDGKEIDQGGAAKEIPSHANRRVVTFTDATVADTATINQSLSPAGAHQLKDADGDGILDGLVVGTADERLQQTKDLLDYPGADVSTLNASERATLATELKAHIDWVRGKDVDDIYDDSKYGEQRYAFNDPLHGSVAAVTYGGTADKPITKLLVGTNDGGIRMLNGHSGVEEWIFYPPAMLPMQTTLRTNPKRDHFYGIDGTPTLWIEDVDDDGVIEPNDGDFVRAFFGMRRGGDAIYALDLTPDSSTFGNGLTDRTSTTDITPKLMWRIKGGGTEYARLGQTWSQPSLATVELGDASAADASHTDTVLLFAGGYDDDQDDAFGSTTDLGNAIYIVDPLTGARLHYVSSDDSGEHGTGDGTVVPDMHYPIPSDLSLLDSDGDNAIDRIYVGDLGGQVWRVDLLPNLAAGAAGLSPVVAKLATLSGSDHPQDARKFFYPPDVVQARNSTAFSSVDKYDIVSIVSGNRAHPLDTTVQDRFFALRDFVTGTLADDGSGSGVAGDGLADNATTIYGALKSPARAGDLLDVTDINFAAGADATAADLAALKAADGYYIDLEEPGEKGLSKPITVAGRVFFTSYLPEAVVSSTDCTLAEGAGRIYGLNVLNGAAALDWDGPDPNPYTKSDRYKTLASGIPSSAAPFFQPDGIRLLVNTGGGNTVFDPEVNSAPQRTFWFQER